MPTRSRSRSPLGGKEYKAKRARTGEYASAGILLIRPDRWGGYEALLGRTAKDGRYRGAWHLLGGRRVSEDVSGWCTACREFAEETGVEKAMFSKLTTASVSMRSRWEPKGRHYLFPLLFGPNSNRETYQMLADVEHKYASRRVHLQYGSREMDYLGWIPLSVLGDTSHPIHRSGLVKDALPPFVCRELQAEAIDIGRRLL